MPDTKVDTLERRRPRPVNPVSPQASALLYPCPRQIRVPVLSVSDAKPRRPLSGCGPSKADPDVGKELMDILFFREGKDFSSDKLPVFSPPARASNPIVNDCNFRRPSVIQVQGLPLASESVRADSCKVSASVAPKTRIEGFFSPIKAVDGHCPLLSRLV